MPLSPVTDPFYLHGITEIGEWTATSATAGGGDTDAFNTDNIYTVTPWGATAEDGATLSSEVSTTELRGGQSAALLDSFVNQVSGTITFNSVTANLETLRRMFGLPASALTGDLGAGTPTKEVLRVLGAHLGTQELQLYVKSDGPLAPRFHYFPRAKIASFPDLTFSRTAYFSPSAGFDLYENSAGEMFWIEDPEA